MSHQSLHLSSFNSVVLVLSHVLSYRFYLCPNPYPIRCAPRKIEYSSPMHAKPIHILSLFTAVTATPFQQGSVTRKDLSSIVDNAVNVVSNAVTGASQAVESAASQVSSAVESAAPLLGSLEALSSISDGVVLNGSIENTALWQEALALDAKATVGSMNQMFYRTVAYLQKIESDPHSSGSGSVSSPSWIAKGLQSLHIYPTQFNQPQAADSAKSLGESFLPRAKASLLNVV